MFPNPSNNVKFGKAASSAKPPTGLYDAVITKVVEEYSTKVFLDGVVDSPSNSITFGVDALVGSVVETAKRERVYARIPRLVGGFEFGPLDFIGQTPAVGDRAFVGFREGRPDNLVLLTRGGTSNLTDLLDVSIVTPLTGQVVTYDGNQWNNASIGLDTLGDVSLSALDDLHILIYNLGTGQWENILLPAGISDHGDLDGLADDDHGQYLLRSELGTGGGVDADLLDGQHGAFYAPVAALDDYALLTALDSYLLLAGGTMAGDIDMAAFDLHGVRNIHANASDGDIYFRNTAGDIHFMYDLSDNSVRFIGPGRIRVPSGTEASPGAVFEADTDTGWYRIGTNTLGISTGGVVAATFESGGHFRSIDGTAAVPGQAFINDSDTGMWRPSLNTGGLAAGGAEVCRFVSTAQTLYSGTDASWSGFTGTARWALHGQAGIIHVCRSAGEAAFFGRNTSDGSIVRFDRSGTQVGSISVTTTTTAYNTSSDERLKKNIIDADTRGTLDKVRGLRVREFDWIQDDHHETGLVAQEVAEVYPDAVTPPDRELVEGERLDEPSELEGSTTWMIDYSKMVPLLLGAVQEQQKEIDSLETRVADLEALVARLVA